MRTRPGTEYLPWTIAGVVFLVALLLVAWRFHSEASPAQLLAFKASRADLVGRMRLSLASASEAERSAVLAITDEDSETYAAQARAANAETERQRQELGAMLSSGGTQPERDLMTRFTAAHADLRRIDDEVLDLAVKNSNLKAYALLYGPAADALAKMDAALADLVARPGAAPGGERVVRLASEARIGVLRIQVQLSPHIAEESDARMDRMEAAMAQEELRVRKALDALAALPRVGRDAALAAAASSLAGYLQLKQQILALSRENTNVRSLSLTLNQERKAMVLCLGDLEALQEAILQEPIRGVTYGRPPSPR
jgi:hypothetical protein